jgi:hypothetical protein
VRGRGGRAAPPPSGLSRRSRCPNRCCRRRRRSRCRSRCRCYGAGRPGRRQPGHCHRGSWSRCRCCRRRGGQRGRSTDQSQRDEQGCHRASDVHVSTLRRVAVRRSLRRRNHKPLRQSDVTKWVWVDPGEGAHERLGRLNGRFSPDNQMRSAEPSAAWSINSGASRGHPGPCASMCPCRPSGASEINPAAHRRSSTWHPGSDRWRRVDMSRW